MGPSGYTVKLEQWEEEDKQLATAGIPNPYDAYPYDHSKNWIRARSKLVIKDRVAVIVFNNKEAEKLSADIVGGNRARRWTPTQQPLERYPSSAAFPKLFLPD
jgi:hypothetical protein